MDHFSDQGFRQVAPDVQAQPEPEPEAQEQYWPEPEAQVVYESEPALVVPEPEIILPVEPPPVPEILQEPIQPVTKELQMDSNEKVGIENVFKPGSSDAGVLPLLAAGLLGNRGPGYGGGFGGDGFGLGGGGGLVGGLLLGGLLGGNGGPFGGNRGGFDNGAESRIQDGQQALAILGKVSTIEAAVPLMGATIANNVQAQTIALNQTLSGINTNVSLVNQNVLVSRGDILAAIAASTATITSKIDTTRIAELEAELGHQRNRGHSKEVEVNVAQTVNQNQLQLQAQQQQQGVNSRLDFLCNELARVSQYAKATNENVIVGNAGATTTGAQTSTPTNVNT